MRSDPGAEASGAVEDQGRWPQHLHVAADYQERVKFLQPEQIKCVDWNMTKTVDK